MEEQSDIIRTIKILCKEIFIKELYEAHLSEIIEWLDEFKGIIEYSIYKRVRMEKGIGSIDWMNEEISNEIRFVNVEESPPKDLVLVKITKKYE